MDAQTRKILEGISTATLTTVLLYLLAQMVGAGNLTHLLFGIPYEAAVVAVGVVMLVYVMAGGMIATTWVQIVKAVLMLGGGLALTALVLFGLGAVMLSGTRCVAAVRRTRR